MTEQHLQPKSAIEKVKDTFKGVHKTLVDGKVLLNDLSQIQDVNKELFQRVYKEKTWIRSKPDEKSGIDYGMMNYVISLPHIFDSATNRLQMLQCFWDQLWPHLSNFLADYDNMATAFDANLMETDDIIKNHGDVVYEAKIQEAFFEKYPGVGNQYKNYKKELEDNWAKEAAERERLSVPGKKGS